MSDTVLENGLDTSEGPSVKTVDNTNLESKPNQTKEPEVITVREETATPSVKLETQHSEKPLASETTTKHRERSRSSRDRSSRDRASRDRILTDRPAPRDYFADDYKSRDHLKGYGGSYSGTTPMTSYPDRASSSAFAYARDPDYASRMIAAASGYGGSEFAGSSVGDGGGVKRSDNVIDNIRFHPIIDQNKPDAPVNKKLSSRSRHVMRMTYDMGFSQPALKAMYDVREKEGPYPFESYPVYCGVYQDVEKGM